MIKIILGDCLEKMKSIEDKSIDLVVTSPPYDNLRSYNNQKLFTFEKFQLIAQQLLRITKIGGVIVWVVGDATIKGSETGTSFKQALYFKEIGFNLHDTMIYRKKSLTYPDTNRYYQCFEYMFIFSNKKPKTFNPLYDRKNKWGNKKAHWGKVTYRQLDDILKEKNGVENKTIKEFGCRFNIWEYSTGKGNSTKDKIAFKHPAIFPEKLAHDHIISWSNENNIVLDPFMGSGTVGKECICLNRSFIGIEKEPKYYKIAKERILQAIANKKNGAGNERKKRRF